VDVPDGVVVVGLGTLMERVAPAAPSPPGAMGSSALVALASESAPAASSTGSQVVGFLIVDILSFAFAVCATRALSLIDR
jgi:hypothetical protein